ncbi:ribosome biogenesis protein LTV1 [Sporobolomyces koalae]|uniref:ribosome biogenesis protein LTV1 n=1 Tax=Sporobolomyces koalae TaxID=500713 RepID=UPI003178CB51
MAPSLWRKPGTKTFQLVHRSQRDPLIHDPEASDRVLKEISKSQKGPQYQANEISFTDPTATIEGIQESPFSPDASSYGIYFNDQEYDYLQHLRSVGDRPDAHLIEAPLPQHHKKSQRERKQAIAGFQEREPEPPTRKQQQQSIVLPEDSLPSHPLDEVSYSNYHKERSEEEHKGLQPDLDPKVREVLEALDDDAYAVSDGEGTDGEDEFWNGVLKGGERNEYDDYEDDYEDEEQDHVGDAQQGIEKLKLANGTEIESHVGAGEWDAVKRFKQQQQQVGSDDEEDYGSEMGDTIAELVKSNARRPKRGAGTVAGSSFSMSSSAMFRNEGLRTLDDRFDQIEKMYEESDDDSWGGGGSDDDDQSEGGEFHGPQREDLEAIMDDFLSRYEVIGGKMRQQLKPQSNEEPVDPEDEEGQRRINASKLDRIRQSLANMDLDGDDASDETALRRKEKERILKIVERQEKEEERRQRKGQGLGTPKVDILEDRRRDRWDCETVLSTYSNLSNHPRLLRIRDNKLKSAKPAQIKLDPKTGFPLVNGELVTGKDTIMEEDEQGEEEEEMEEYIPKETIKRSRTETAEEKKLRKAQVKQERQSRRNEKKATKESFEQEVKRQKKVGGRRVAEGGAADIRPGVEGVRRLA